MARIEKITTHILVCKHKTCCKRGAKEVERALRETVKEHGLRREVLITGVDCLDQCSRAPLACVYPDGVWYEKLDETAARALIENHVLRHRVLEHHILHDFSEAAANKAREQENLPGKD